LEAVSIGERPSRRAISRTPAAQALGDLTPEQPIANIGKLDGIICTRYVAEEPSYWTFYSKVLKGQIR
jgi:hypothetical protein